MGPKISVLLLKGELQGSRDNNDPVIAVTDPANQTDLTVGGREFDTEQPISISHKLTLQTILQLEVLPFCTSFTP